MYKKKNKKGSKIVRITVSILALILVVGLAGWMWASCSTVDVSKNVITEVPYSYQIMNQDIFETSTTDSNGDEVLPTNVVGKFWRNNAMTTDITTLVDGVLTITPANDSSAKALKYIPVDANGDEYIGEYTVSYTLTNNSASTLQWTHNLNGDGNDIITNAPAYSTVKLTHTVESTESGTSFNFKYKNGNVGTYVMSDIIITEVVEDSDEV